MVDLSDVLLLSDHPTLGEQLDEAGMIVSSPLPEGENSNEEVDPFWG